MTAKEAVESLMLKDKNNPTLKALKKQGILNEILYPEGRPPEVSEFANARLKDKTALIDNAGSSKRIRSIAKPSKEAENVNKIWSKVDKSSVERDDNVKPTAKKVYQPRQEPRNNASPPFSSFTDTYNPYKKTFNKQYDSSASNDYFQGKDNFMNSFSTEFDNNRIDSNFGLNSDINMGDSDIDGLLNDLLKDINSSSKKPRESAPNSKLIYSFLWLYSNA